MSEPKRMSISEWKCENPSDFEKVMDYIKELILSNIEFTVTPMGDKPTIEITQFTSDEIVSQSVN